MKRFRKSLEMWIIISLLYDTFPNLAILRKTFVSENIPTSTFKKWDFFNQIPYG